MVMQHYIACMPDAMLLSSFPFPVNRAAAFARKMAGTKRKARVHNRPIMTERNTGYETPACKSTADRLGLAHRRVCVAPH